jgi:hypothetical protein
MRKLDLTRLKPDGVANNAMLSFSNTANAWVATNTLRVVDATITGNLTVTGTTTYINTTNLDVGDNIITLNADVGSGVSPTENAGISINRGSSANVALLWDESVDQFTASANLNTVGTLSANVLTVSNVSVTQTNLQVDPAGMATAMAIVFGG